MNKRSFIWKLVPWCLAAGLLAGIGCKKSEQDQKMEEWAKYTAQVDITKSNIAKAETEMLKLANRYNEMMEKKGEDLSMVDITEQEQMDPFERLAFWSAMRMKKEQEVGIMPMLDEIYDLNRKIVEMEEEVKNISTSFRAPYEVKWADTHFQLGLKFLSQNYPDLGEKKKMRLLYDAGLWDELAVGFLVYFYYDGERLHTSVHKGKAEISPTAHRRKIDAARDSVYRAKADSMLAIIREKEAKNDSLAMRIAELDNDIAEKLDVIQTLETDKKQLQQENVEKQQLVDKLDKAQHSVFYAVARVSDLKQRGMYSGGFLFFSGPSIEAEKTFKSLAFDNSIDTRETNIINVDGMNEGKVVLYTETGAEVEEKDYTYAWYGKNLKINLKRTEPFTGKKLLVLVK